MLLSVVCFGQKKIGSYSCSYFHDERYVAYSTESNQYYVQIFGESSTRECIFVIKDIDNFRQSLAEVKKKYEEWCNVAKANKVTSMDKDMDIKFKSGDFAWMFGSNWYFNFFATPKPRFLITSDGEYLCLLFSGKEFESSSNEYITEKAYWVFSSLSEIEELENAISLETLQKFKESEKSKDDLFR